MVRGLDLAARWMLGIIFIYASYDKILHPAAFAKAVYNYQILPDMLINLTALILPWMELLLGFFLIAGIWLAGATALVNLLLIIFSTAIFFNLARGLNIHCGCFSTAESGDPITIGTVLRDSLMLIPAFFLLIRHVFQKK